MQARSGLVRSWVEVRSALTGLLLIAIGVLSRLPQLGYNQYPFIQCDENIYFLESQRMLAEQSVIFNEFRGGGINFLPTVISVLLGLELDEAGLQLLGRIFLTAVIGGLAPFFAFLVARKLSNGELIPLAVGLTAAFSPLLLLNSVYWYPDSYIATVALATIWFALGFTDSTSIHKRRLILLGVLCGVGLSVKVTFLAIALFVVLIIWKKNRSGSFKSTLLPLGASTIISWMCINWPALITPFDFIRNNGGNIVVYQGSTRSVEGLVFYAIAAGPMAVGVLQFCVAVIGGLFAFRRRNFIGIFASVLVASAVCIFGLQAQWLHRNMDVFFAFSIILLTLGFKHIAAVLSGGSAWIRILSISIMALYLGLGATQFVQDGLSRQASVTGGVSIHEQATNFLLNANPGQVSPADRGCQRSIYEELLEGGWSPGSQTLQSFEVVYTNDDRSDFVSDPVISFLPDSLLTNITQDLYRPEAGVSWFSNQGALVDADEVAAEFSDGYFRYLILED